MTEPGPALNLDLAEHALGMQNKLQRIAELLVDNPMPTITEQRIRELLGDDYKVRERDDPEELMEVGSRCNSRLIAVINNGYNQGAEENHMVEEIFKRVVDSPVRMNAAMVTAALFRIAKGLRDG